MTDPKTIYLQPECCADPEVGRLWCEDDAPETCEDGVPWTKYVLASERAKQAEPVAWMVGNDPMTAATYNAGDKEKAFDAAKRWNWSITGLSVIAGAPDFDINYQQTEPVAVGHDGKSWPHTLDAKAWADEFCKRNTATDNGTMIAWFANAIEFARAYDASPPAVQAEPVMTAPLPPLHTEESLMALVDEYYRAYPTTLGALETEQAGAAVRLAIREVLAERDIHKDEAEAQRILRTQQRERAERAEAEVERLRELIAELDGHEGAEGWSEGMRERIDAALKEQQ